MEQLELLNGFVDPRPVISRETLTADQFIMLHQLQLEQSGVPRVYWEVLHAKIKNDTFDAGLDFSLMRVEFENNDETGWKVLVTNPEGVAQNESENIYLVDHAWTFNQTNAFEMLETIDGLLDRMASLMDIDQSNKSIGDTRSSVMDNMWRFCQTYSFRNAQQGSDEAMPVWFIMDEFGSRIQHSNEPSVKMVPFYYVPTGTVYSIFWPIRDLQCDDEVTRDFVPHIPLDQELKRQSHLVPWIPCDFTEIDEIPEQPDEDYFKMSKYDQIDNKRVPVLPEDREILVWTTDPLVEKYLTDSRFKTTDDRNQADIIWDVSHLQDFKNLSERNVFINQFPYESLLTTKDLLATVARRAAPVGCLCPRWLPTTYNLNTELPEFLSHYQKREERQEDNHWIAKPWNLGRGLGHVITKNINCLVRLPESGPFVACKYIEEPVLFDRPDGLNRVKFDFRYVVLVKSIRPLKLSCYRKFFLRFANKPYSLDQLEDYEKHFTVHNYSNPAKLLNLNCEDFIPSWGRQYPDFPWSSIESESMQCLKELFEAASSMDPPYGMSDYPQARGHYGCDLMLKWDTDTDGRRIMVPQILEVNFSPDSGRGCRNYPQYFNVVFTALFLNDKDAENENEIVVA